MVFKFSCHSFAFYPCFLFVFTDKLLLQRYRNQLRSVVYEAAELTFFENDELNVDDVSFYKNEVSVFMYDAKGRLIAPMNNVRGYVNALLDPIISKLSKRTRSYGWFMTIIMKLMHPMVPSWNRIKNLMIRNV